MSPVNKYEAIGIFLSVAIMAIALTLLRFETSVFSMSTEGESQVATGLAGVSTVEDTDSSLETELRDAMSLDGVVQKLVVDDIRFGTGEGAKVGDTVTVHYIGTLRDGTQFDNSYLRGTPFTFTLGENKVIAGWEQGVVGMKAGGQRVLVIPAELAYGNRQVGPIPPDATLMFAIELLSIQ
jgi:FKBP-type peptidyl-prolyl cis-trans isomerase